MGKLFAIVALLLLFSATYAQPNGMTPRQAATEVSRQQNANYTPKLDLFVNRQQAGNSTSPISNVKVQYYVLKKDSTGMNVKSKIYMADDGRYFLSTENKEKGDEVKRIYAGQTIKINFVDYREQKTVEAIANDSSWMFKVLEGKINLYDNYPPMDGDVYNGGFSAFQLGDGAIEPLDEERLKQIMHDNPQALEALEKGDIAKAVKRYNKD
jgi:hypothetical protein